jgi:hypothetical protein
MSDRQLRWLSFLDLRQRIADVNLESANWRWCKVAQDILDHGSDYLTETEKNFLREAPTRRVLSEGQQRWIHWLYIKIAKQEPLFAGRIHQLVSRGDFDA